MEKIKIKEVLGSLDRDTVARACRSFRSRIEAVIITDGNFIEVFTIFFYFNNIGSFSAVLCYFEKNIA